ncbi:MAG: efflux RND transporter permease subunit [Candidatus Latescibacterota bacterium]|nr:MAG: efflux RND transporter permease subunit [Candidatus Latescibacterota bacterium]
MNIIRFSITRPVTIAMIFIAAVVFGFVSLSRLDLRLLPEISYPTLTVQTEYPDAAPLEVENFVSRPLEEAVGVIPGLRRMSSVSKPGMSEITLEFAWDTPMDYAALDVREKIDLIELPRECRQPVILRYDPALDPVIRLGVFGDENLVRLRYIADRTIKKEIESLDGIASAKVLGGLEEEIHVELDERKIASLGIPISLVSARLLQDNINQSGGKLRDSGSEFLLRTENEFENVDDIRNTIVTQVGDRKIVLADIGDIWRGYREREVITRINGEEAVEVAIHKEGDANTVEVARRIRSRVQSLQRELPENVKMEVLFDQSRFIKTSINEVLSNAIIGAFLAVTILFLFLRDLRSTAIIGLSIPISVLATFVMMRQLSVSLNLMSLGGLALGIGMLVDNSIVVLESISRQKEKGLERKEATYQGASGVGRAVIASTLTSVAVFLPIVFVEGIAGQVFKDQALTVSISLLASLVVALMLIPMISSLQGRTPQDAAAVFGEAPPPKQRRKPTRIIIRTWKFIWETVPIAILRVVRKLVQWVSKAMGFAMRPLLGGFSRLYGVVERRYDPMLDWALGHRGLFLTSVLILFCVSIWASQFIGAELIPQFSQGEFSFNVNLPEGSPLDATDSRLRDMEDITNRTDGVERYFTMVGQASRLGSNAKTKDKNIGQLNVVLEDKGNKRLEEQIIQQLRQKFAAIEGMTYKFARPMYFTLQTPVAVEVYGYNLELTKQVADRFERELAKIDGIKDVKSSMEVGNPELNIVFDRERLSAFGLSLDEVSNNLKTKIHGEVPTKFKEREIQVDIRVRTSAWQAENIGELNSLVVGEQDGTPIALSTVADVGVGRGLSQITRISQQRAAIVSGNLSGRDLGSVSRDVQALIDRTPLPGGITVELGGQNEELNRSFRSLVFALILAVFLVYLVMAAQFESFVHPFIILFTVPMGAIGVVWILLLTGQTLSVVVFIGVIMLAGIVVNNAIVLIDYINQLRRGGMAKLMAIREAGRVRLRPIIMTTMTTVLGLLPMALGLGEGAEIRAPMALTVIGGLLGATFLTLLVIPALYSVVARGK